MPTLSARVSIVALWLVMIAACSRTGGPSQPQPHVEDTTRIVLAIEQSGYAADALYPTGEVPIADATHPEPVAFRRTLERIDRFNAYTFSEPDANGVPAIVTVMVCKYPKARIQVVRQYAPQDPTPDDSTDRVFDKLAYADWIRYLRLRRDATMPAGWRVLAVSEAWLLVDNKRGCCNTEVVGVRLRQGAVEIDMPVSNATGIDSLIAVGTDPITVSVTTANPDDVVLLHDAAGAQRLASIGGNVYEGPLTLLPGGLRHFTVEALTDSSVADSTVRVSQHGFTMMVRTL